MARVAGLARLCRALIARPFGDASRCQARGVPRKGGLPPLRLTERFGATGG